MSADKYLSIFSRQMEAIVYLYQLRKCKMKFDKFTDVCMSGGQYVIPPVLQTSVYFSFSTYIFSADITPDMLKPCRVTKVNVLFLVLVYVFDFNLFEFSAAILEKGLYWGHR